MDRSVRIERTGNRLSRFTSIVWLLLGATFIVSGILKAISVKGFALTVREFLDLLGLSYMQSYAFSIAVAICILETAIGALAFIRSLRPLLSLIYPGVMTFFTLITYINLTDMYGGIESCGCFGEVIHLGPTETFVKNLFLLTLSVMAAFMTCNDLKK